MEDNSYDKFLSALREFREDLTNRIESMQQNVDRKLDKLSTEYEKSREQIVRLETHMDYMQTSLAEAKIQIHRRVDKVQEQTNSYKENMTALLNQKVAEECLAREKQITNLDTVIQSVVNLKLQNSSLTLKIFIYSGIIICGMFFIKVLVSKLFNVTL